MHYLNKIFLLPILLMNLLQANDIYEDNALGVVLLMGDAGFGSGVIISSKGYVLTNNHVIENNENLEVILSYHYDLDEYEEYVHTIEVIKQDKVKDLALIKINNPRTALKAIKISRKVPSIGSMVHAIGHPDL